jgi:hypothetical protein
MISVCNVYKCEYLHGDEDNGVFGSKGALVEEGRVGEGATLDTLDTETLVEADVAEVCQDRVIRR